MNISGERSLKFCINFYLGHIKVMPKREAWFAPININKLIDPKLYELKKTTHPSE